MGDSPYCVCIAKPPGSSSGIEVTGCTLNRLLKSPDMRLGFVSVFLLVYRMPSRAASPNISLTPSPVNEEHSMYCICGWKNFEDLRPAPRRRATSSACCLETGFCEVFASSSMVLGSYLRSVLQPTRILGMYGRKW